jgi:hypothetical protein
LKTVVPQGTVGSNPTFSAKETKASREAGFFCSHECQKLAFVSDIATKKDEAA